MKSAVLHQIEDIRLEEVEVPKLEEDEVLVRVKACGVCGTDLHFFEGTWSVKMPIVPGHEFSGIVEDMGREVRRLKKGDKVAVDPNITCGNCYWCQRSTKNYYCENLVALGVDLPGAFAEFVKAPEKVVYKLSEEMSFEEGAFVEPLGCCLRGWDNLNFQAGETVAIIGAGPIGLLHTQIARISGASKIIVLDVLEDRLNLAQKLGADFTVNVTKEDPIKRVYELTESRGADIVIEAVGKPEAVEQAFEIAARGGRVNIFSVCPQSSKVNLMPFEHLYWKELTVSAAFRDPFTCQRAIELLSAKRIQITPIITHRLMLEDIKEAFELMKDKTKGAIKIVILPE